MNDASECLKQNCLPHACLADLILTFILKKKLTAQIECKITVSSKVPPLPMWVSGTKYAVLEKYVQIYMEVSNVTMASLCTEH